MRAKVAKRLRQKSRELANKLDLPKNNLQVKYKGVKTYFKQVFNDQGILVPQPIEVPWVVLQESKSERSLYNAYKSNYKKFKSLPEGV